MAVGLLSVMQPNGSLDC